jgi:hypothetical protein
MIRRIVDAVVQGEIDPDTPADRRMQRRLEGAIVALEATAKPTATGSSSPS